MGYSFVISLQGDWLYIHNYKPDRWPGGNPEAGYLNCDSGPTKTLIMQQRRANLDDAPYWDLRFRRRRAEEFYNLAGDPDCVRNLAGHVVQQQHISEYRRQMEDELLAQGDPRMSGEGDVFDRHQYSNPVTVHFYEQFLSGEHVGASWLTRSDFEPKPLD